MSKVKQLPSHIVSLIHHVELYQSGWWDKGVQNLIIACIGNSGNTLLTSIQVFDQIKREFGIDIDWGRFEKQWNNLSGDHVIVRTGSQKQYQLNKEYYDRFLADLDSQNAIEESSKNKFLFLSRKHCPGLDPENLWKEFNENLLIPLVKTIGARTYELISGQQAKVIDYPSFKTFVQRYAESSEQLQELIIDYLSPQNEEVKKYIIHQLYAFFFLEATGLTEGGVSAIAETVRGQLNLNVFVDTNLLLTILNLHDNPSNLATNSLLNLIKEVDNRVKIKLYITPVTRDEFINLIQREKRNLESLRPTQNMIKALLDQGEVSGVLKTYFEKCIEGGVTISPDSYFGPYVDDFIIMIRNFGLEIYLHNIEDSVNIDEIHLDIANQIDFRLKKRYGIDFDETKLPKGVQRADVDDYKNLIHARFRHDAVVWHFVRGLRPLVVDNPLTTRDWICTLDFSFLQFDRYKQKKDSNLGVGLCVHPNELISMLQIWVPRTPAMETAIMGNFKLPFLFQDFDRHSEAVTFRIISTLSRFQGAENLSESTITQILASQTLRERIKSDKHTEENIELIEREMAELLSRKEKELEQQRSKNKDLESDKHELSKEVNDLRNDVERLERNQHVYEESQRKLIERQAEQVAKLVDQVSKLASSRHEERTRLLQTEADAIRIRLNDQTKLRTNLDRKIESDFHKASWLQRIRFGSSLRERIKRQVDSGVWDQSEYDGLQDLLRQKEKMIAEAREEGNTIVYCENQNEAIFNRLGLDRIRFVAKPDSRSVFDAARGNPDHYAIRDKDYLLPEEIQRIQTKHPNIFILNFYCLESYLYHPDNIHELGLSGFNRDQYVQELLDNRDKYVDEWLPKIDYSRSRYEELTTQFEFKSKSSSEISAALRSSNFETLYPYLDMKKHRPSGILGKMNLTQEQLSRTFWFKQQILNVLKF